jgi:hypothetical protein
MRYHCEKARWRELVSCSTAIRTVEKMEKQVQKEERGRDHGMEI